MLAHSQVLIRQFLLVYTVKLSGARAKVHGRLVMKNKHTAALRRVAGSKTKRRINRWRNARAQPWLEKFGFVPRVTRGPILSIHSVYSKQELNASELSSRCQLYFSGEPVSDQSSSCGNRENVRRWSYMMALYVRYVHSLLSLQKMLSLLNCIGK